MLVWPKCPKQGTHWQFYIYMLKILYNLYKKIYVILGGFLLRNFEKALACSQVVLKFSFWRISFWKPEFARLFTRLTAVFFQKNKRPSLARLFATMTLSEELVTLRNLLLNWSSFWSMILKNINNIPKKVISIVLKAFPHRPKSILYLLIFFYLIQISV